MSSILVEKLEISLSAGEIGSICLCLKKSQVCVFGKSAVSFSRIIRIVDISGNQCSIFLWLGNHEYHCVLWQLD